MRSLPFLLLLAASGVASPLTAAELLPHRALYSLSLARTSTGSQLANAVGDMRVEWQDVCDGWASVTEMRFRLLYQEGEEGRIGTSVTAWESKDGLSYRFFLKRRSSFSGDTERSGTARLDAPNGGGEVVYDAPEVATVELPQGTLFPTAHLLEIITLAESGGTSLLRPVFDGSEEDEFYEVSAFLFGRVPEGEPPALPSDLLNDVPSWRLGMAYFVVGDETGAPQHEATLRLYANGVVDEQLFDFGDFALRARLVELQPEPAPDC